MPSRHPVGHPLTRALFRKKRTPPELKAGAQVTEHRLRNGLQVLLAERHSDPVVAVLLYYRVGARNETEREAGMAHFLEHMMFKGSERLRKGEVDRLTTQLGGQNNAFTGYDHTGYWFEFASDRWETALEIEVDRMTGLTLDPAEFEAERAVVLEELSMGEDDPWAVLTRHVGAHLFPRHPYARPIIGFADSLRSLSPADMRDFHRRFYHPANATLVLCGDIRPSSALRTVRRYFGAVPAGPSMEEADCFRPAPDEPAGEVRLERTWDDMASRVCMAWPTAPVGTDEDYAFDLIVTVLTTGRMSRLQRRLVLDEGLASSIAASNDARVDTGCFWLLAECAQGVEAAALEAALDEELARLRDELVSPAELKRARAALDASEAFQAETVTEIAEELGDFAVDIDWRLAFDGGRRHKTITAKRLRDFARQYLTPQRRVVGWSRPAKAGEANR